MALIAVGRTGCAICDRILEIGDQIVATSHFIADPTDPLWAFSDAAMHKECFLRWDQRQKFVRRYNAIFSKLSFASQALRKMDGEGKIDGEYSCITGPPRALEVIGPSLFRNLDEVTQYIYLNYLRLMTELETDVYHYFWNKPMQESEAEERGQEEWYGIPDNESARDMIAKGPIEFMKSVRDRILKEHSAEVHLNRCPSCDGLARTPTARQCPKCLHSWHQIG